MQTRAYMPRSHARAAAGPRLRHWAAGMILPVLCLYFAFYLVFGPRGLIAWHRIDAQLQQTQSAYDALLAKRQALEADVKLMRPDSLDPDMAEEQARKTLGYTKSGEAVIDLD